MAKEKKKKDKEVAQPIESPVVGDPSLTGTEDDADEQQMFSGACPHCDGPFVMLVAVARKKDDVAKAAPRPVPPAPDDDESEDDEEKEDEEDEETPETDVSSSDTPPVEAPAIEPDESTSSPEDIDSTEDDDEDKEDDEEDEEEPEAQYQNQSPALKSETPTVLKSFTLDQIADLLADRIISKITPPTSTPIIHKTEEQPIAKIEKVTPARVLSLKSLPDESFFYIGQHRRDLPYKNTNGEIDLGLLTASARMYVNKSMGGVQVPRDTTTFNNIVLKMIQAFKDVNVTPPEYLKTI